MGLHHGGEHLHKPGQCVVMDLSLTIPVNKVFVAQRNGLDPTGARLVMHTCFVWLVFSLSFFFSYCKHRPSITSCFLVAMSFFWTSLHNVMSLYIVLRVALSTRFSSARTVLAGMGTHTPPAVVACCKQFGLYRAWLCRLRGCVVAGTCLGVLALIVVRECFQRKRLNRSYNPNVTCVRLQFAGIVDVVFWKGGGVGWTQFVKPFICKNRCSLTGAFNGAESIAAIG